MVRKHESIQGLPEMLLVDHVVLTLAVRVARGRLFAVIILLGRLGGFAYVDSLLSQNDVPPNRGCVRSTYGAPRTRVKLASAQDLSHSCAAWSRHHFNLGMQNQALRMTSCNNLAASRMCHPGFMHLLCIAAALCEASCLAA